MIEIILGILGGGTLVQLINLLVTYRQNRRQLNASALGGEVEALERTIRLLQENLERETQRHNQESERLRSQIERLEKEVCELRTQCALLEASRMGIGQSGSRDEILSRS